VATARQDAPRCPRRRSWLWAADGAHLRGQPRAQLLLDQRRTVADWLGSWLAGKQQLRPGSSAGYASHIRLYLTPVIGHFRLEQLQVSHMMDIFEAIDELNDTVHADGPVTRPSAPRLRTATGGARRPSIGSARRYGRR
jgi:hypothetical protein